MRVHGLKTTEILRNLQTTFSLEALKLFEKESYFAGGLYVVLSVVCCVVGVFCGRKLALAVL